MLNALKHMLKVFCLTGGVFIASTFGFASTELSETIEQSGLSGSFLASRIAISDQDDEAAMQFLERAVALDPEDAKLKQDLFVALVANGQIDEAVKVIRGIEHNAANRNLVGFVFAAQELRKRSWNAVSGALKEVAGVDLDKTLREITLAWGLAGQRKYEDAFTKLDSLAGPEWVKVLKNYHHGLIAQMDGRDDVAEQKFQAVVDNRAVIAVLTETYIRAIEALVRNRSKVGEIEKAKSSLAYGLQLLPDHAPFKQMEEVLESEQVLKPILTTPSEGVAEIFYNVASAIQRDGNTNTVAKTYLQLSSYLAPEADVVTIGLAELYLRQGSYEKSNLYYERIPDTSPFYRISQLEKASNLARLERKDEAIETLNTLVDENPVDLSGYMALGSIYSRDKQYREAADIFDKAVNQIGEPQTYHWNLFFRRGIAYERLKEWEKAEPNFKQSLSLSANQPEVLNYLGYSWIDQGVHLDEGMDMIRKAVDLRPRSGFIVDSLGWAYYRLGRYEEAVEELERAVTLMPQDPTINDHLGDAYWKVGRKLEATFQWKIALAAKTPPEYPEKIERKLDVGLMDDEENSAKTE